MDIVVERIKEQRKRLGITQQQLAFDTGLSVGGIQSIETGRAKPNIETLSKLADRFNCSTDYLLGRSDEQEPKPVSPYDSWKSIHEKLEKSTDLIGIFGKQREEKIRKMISVLPAPDSELDPTSEDEDFIDEIFIEILNGYADFKETVRLAQKKREEEKKDTSE